MVQTRNNSLIVVLLLLAVLAATIPLVLKAVPSAHAIERHGYFQASIANECRDDPNAHVFRNPTTGRTAYVCMTRADKWGLAVVDRVGRDITAFIKNRMTSFEQVAHYLQNVGYVLVK
jgi:hypothetical protein